jgi:hypothetical protein
MARKDKKTRKGSAKPSRTRQRRTVAVGPDRVRARIERLMRDQRAAPLSRTERGWVMAPTGVPKVHFLPRVTQFEWPAASEVAAVGADAVSAGRHVLEVRAGSKGERLLVHARLRGSQDPTGAAAARASHVAAAIGRAAQLLRSTGIRSMATKTRLILLEDAPVRVMQTADGFPVLEFLGTSRAAVGARSTRFEGVPANELPEGADEAVRGDDGLLTAPAGSAAERSLFAACAREAAAVVSARAEDERSRAETARRAEAMRVQHLQSRLEANVDRWSRQGAPVELRNGALLYDGFAFGSPRIDGEDVVWPIRGLRTHLRADDRAGSVILRELEKVAHALRAVAEELTALGAMASLDERGMWVSGDLVAAPTNGAPDLDRVVAQCCLELLEARVARELAPLLDEPIETSASDGMVRLYDDDFVLGSVRATRAEIGGSSIDGSFTRAARRLPIINPTTDWTRLADAIASRRLAHAAEFRRREAESARRVELAQQREERRRSASARVVVDTAPQLPESLVGECLEASEDIRLRRTAAFSNPVTLVAPSFQLTFQPITAHGPLLSVRFHYESSALSVDGTLRLSERRDPLPVVLHGAVDSEQAGRIWAAVLLGFATLTVLPEFASARNAPRAYSRPIRSGTSEPHDRRVPRGRYRGFGHALVATGWTATAHWVVGHVRTLSDGREASAEAEREAARVGIRLRPGETWVRPHVRGGSPDRVLTFRWTLPGPLARAMRTAGR